MPPDGVFLRETLPDTVFLYGLVPDTSRRSRAVSAGVCRCLVPSGSVIHCLAAFHAHILNTPPGIHRRRCMSCLAVYGGVCRCLVPSGTAWQCLGASHAKMRCLEVSHAKIHRLAASHAEILNTPPEIHRRRCISCLAVYFMYAGVWRCLPVSSTVWQYHTLSGGISCRYIKYTARDTTVGGVFYVWRCLKVSGIICRCLAAFHPKMRCLAVSHAKIHRLAASHAGILNKCIKSLIPPRIHCRRCLEVCHAKYLIHRRCRHIYKHIKCIIVVTDCMA